jgi:hypothetical protein
MVTVRGRYGWHRLKGDIVKNSNRRRRSGKSKERSGREAAMTAEHIRDRIVRRG